MTHRNNIVNRFSTTPSIKGPRSTFDLSHRRTTTIDVDYIYPIFAEEYLPGDSWNVSTDFFARINTPIFPIMDNMIGEIFYFDIPLWVIWDNARRFFGERTPDPDTTIDLTVPILTAYQPALKSLSDYFDLPCVEQLDGANTITPTSLFHRSYNSVYNEWFRDENLQDSVTVDTDDGPDAIADYVLLKSNKKHDYFTSCLPNLQKGVAVTLPLGTTADVLSTGEEIRFENAVETFKIQTQSATNNIIANITAGSSSNLRFDDTGTEDTGLYTDLSTATAATITQWREALQIQVLLEKDMRGGTRYAELVQSHFGVSTPELPWRPIFLNGGRTYAQINPVAQTSASDTQPTPQGNLAAIGTMAGKNIGFTKSFSNHGIILGLIVIRADLTYAQGMAKKFTRSTRYDYYWPSFANLSEQPVLNQEIYADGTASDLLVFGYQERHADYRFITNKLTALMRPQATGTLAAWNLSQDFGTLPTLNTTFIASTTPMERVTAVNTEPDLLLDIYFKVRTARAMPIRAIPAGLGRF